MSFMNTYKRLDKLCRDLLNDERGLSAYIDIIHNYTDGAYYVDGWIEDLKALKHYRWVRNKIAHEPEVTENDLCDADDEEWLLDFYHRILQQTDPLALYHQAKHPNHSDKMETEHPPSHSYGDILCAVIEVCGAIVILACFVWFLFYFFT